MTIDDGLRAAGERAFDLLGVEHDDGLAMWVGVG
jgi:hypothetical protein